MCMRHVLHRFWWFCHPFVCYGLGWHRHWIVKDSSWSCHDNKLNESTCDISWQCLYRVCHLGYFYLQIILYNLFGWILNEDIYQIHPLKNGGHRIQIFSSGLKMISRVALYSGVYSMWFTHLWGHLLCTW